MKKYLDDLRVDLDPAQTRIINTHTVIFSWSINTQSNQSKRLQIANTARHSAHDKQVMKLVRPRRAEKADYISCMAGSKGGVYYCLVVGSN